MVTEKLAVETLEESIERSGRLEVIQDGNGESWVRHCGDCCSNNEAYILALQEGIDEDRITTSICSDCKESYYREFRERRSIRDKLKKLQKKTPEPEYWIT